MSWHAVFCTADIPAKTINRMLRKAKEPGMRDALWLATEDWRAAHGWGNATQPFIKSFTSPFLGKSLESLAETLRAAPSEADLNREYFVVLDQRTLEDQKTLLICVVGKDGAVDQVRSLPDGVCTNMGAMEVGNPSWDEIMEERDGNLEVYGDDFLHGLNFNGSGGDEDESDDTLELPMRTRL